ncbi:hypothetical protein [Metapseudomonas furukawaii]|uniref:Uncharacterized protein n=1 Tax=Metapseudomonas furukawaii TaxID=1149133 RepID=A0AAD1C574_METFU|nr:MULTISPECIES: hypothetical protein [Pseudomonas]ELS29271.1 hypothetical protein ppKF707_0096 [Pseudomonas furukawaii]OWJ95942.1 hypothetical protein B6S59_08415 [Pseudomonas sp. A46]WAG78218.1 hypothetical protein LMK08_23090 [Pseudomonas furukawaii]BAU76458.1 hypothetical protein KF707C_47700 [Pseudomonas furukawaii]
MSLQALWAMFLAHPAQVVNGLALFFACAGAWVLLATRLRERRSVARLAAEADLDAAATSLDEASQRLNRFFYAFGYFSLAVALGVSWASTRL